MSKIKILIAEDELIIAEAMKDTLQSLDYDVIGIACDCREAQDLIKENKPDICLIDIKLRGCDDGIELAKTIRKTYNIPIIFITSHSDKGTVDRAKDVHPQGYIVKPFEKKDLYTSIEIAFSNFMQSNSVENDRFESSYFIQEYLFVKENHKFVKIRINEIQWIKSEGNYLELHCRDSKKYLIRSTFNTFLKNVSLKTLLQVHRSYAVNIDYVDSIQNDEIIINNEAIPIGSIYRDNLIKRLRIIL